MEPVKKLFRGSYGALYEGCELLALSVQEELVAMNGFKAKYKQAWVDGFVAKIEAARLLEDEDQRQARHMLQRIALVRLTDEKISEAMGDLRLYIKEAFKDKALMRLELKGAGFGDMRKALNYNWRLLRTVMGKMHKFIGEHEAELMANENMPVGFAASFGLLKEAVDSQVPAFLNTLENVAQGTQAKIVASNALYLIATGVCADGKHLFRRNPAKQRQFLWDAIMDIVSPPGRAGLKFDVKEMGSNKPLGGVMAVVQREGGEVLTVVTNEKGRGVFDSLHDGVYAGGLELEGYDKVDVKFKIRKGVMSFKHWMMNP